MRYFIDVRNNELYELTDVCVNLSKRNIFGQTTPMELPSTAIELVPKIIKNYKLLFLTKNIIKNIQLYFDKDLNLYIQSQEWLKVCKILKYKLNIGLKPAKDLMDKKIRGINKEY